MYKELFHVTLGSREDREQVPHVMDSDSDCRDIPNFKQPPFLHTKSKLGDSFSGNVLSRLVSNPIGFTFKFLLSVEILRKRCDPAAESESKSNSIGVASPPHGPKCLVRPRFSFRTPWDVLPPHWPPPFSPI